MRVEHSVQPNCAGGIRSPHTWITCEEVIKRLNGKKHGYLFEIDASADGPVAATSNQTEFCGGCFDPDGKTFYLNQQGGRGSLPGGPANARAVTYAIYGPF